MTPGNYCQAHRWSLYRTGNSGGEPISRSSDTNTLRGEGEEGGPSLADKHEFLRVQNESAWIFRVYTKMKMNPK